MQCTMVVCSDCYQRSAALWKMNRGKEKQLLYKDCKLCRISASQVFKVIRLMLTTNHPHYSVPTAHCVTRIFHCCIKRQTLEYILEGTTLYNHVKQISAVRPQSMDHGSVYEHDATALSLSLGKFSFKLIGIPGSLPRIRQPKAPFSVLYPFFLCQEM